MGIPYYFYTLTKTYKSILINSIDNIPIDFLFLDFNGIIHPVSSKYQNDELIFNALWNKVLEYIKLYNPKKLHICTDGIAPLAKVIQQRKRRYLSTLRKKLDNENNNWDSNAITPGTNFMKKLNNYMTDKVRYHSNTNTIIYYSGSNEVGEGEHKILNIIKNSDYDNNIVVNGLDADLIILSLMSHKNNIYLMRETTEKNNNIVYNYLNINNLRKAIISELISKWNLEKLEEYDNIFSDKSNNLIDNYCVMCSLLGNDFIPHLLTLNLKNNGLELILNYTKNSINANDFLVIEDKINHKCLTDIFSQLANTEDTDLYKLTEIYLNKNEDRSKTNSDYYAIKNKDPIAKEIYSNFKNWKHIYYKYMFNTNILVNSSIIFNACENYIKGIYWTFNYYKFGIIDHEWYYPYEYPPTLKDITNHSIGNSVPEIKQNGEFISNDIQLLIVLPKTSANLMNQKLIKYTESIDHGLYHIFPEKYKIITYLKTHLWECSPILPRINIEYIKKMLNN
tara:strand:+ start:633 stop:2156 length:1524 start_codon:yes stop_codon:yes gene_type:complete